MTSRTPLLIIAITLSLNTGAKNPFDDLTDPVPPSTNISARLPPPGDKYPNAAYHAVGPSEDQDPGHDLDAAKLRRSARLRLAFGRSLPEDGLSIIVHTCFPCFFPPNNPQDLSEQDSL